MQVFWRDIEHQIRRMADEGKVSEPQVLREFERDVDDWERGARRRVTKALVDGLRAWARYEGDVAFHQAIEMIAALAECAVFDETVVTDAEVRLRREQMQMAVDLPLSARGWDWLGPPTYPPFSGRPS